MLQVYPDKGSKLDTARAEAVLERQRYEPGYSPKKDDSAAYAVIQGRMLLNKPIPKAPPKMLVGWHGQGGVPLPSAPEWRLNLLTGFDNAGRPSAEFLNATTNVTVSFLIWENLSGTPTAEGCRKDILDAIRKNQPKLISNETMALSHDGHGNSLATASNLTYLGAKGHNHNVFAFAGSAKTCAEVHASVLAGTSGEEDGLRAALALFHPDLVYRPTWVDYYAEATAFYLQSPGMAAPFYDAALKAMPEKAPDPEVLKARRIATDNVVSELGMMGDIRKAREYAERGIKLDPDYPLNYYQLACADAEEGKTADAKVHLREAFDRKQNVLPGESMPDPSKDDSIRKLKHHADFWAFVMTLK